MGFEGVAEVLTRWQLAALMAAGVEAADGVGRTLGDAFQLEFYHGFQFLVGYL